MHKSPELPLAQAFREKLCALLGKVEVSPRMTLQDESGCIYLEVSDLAAFPNPTGRVLRFYSHDGEDEGPFLVIEREGKKYLVLISSVLDIVQMLLQEDLVYLDIRTCTMVSRGENVWKGFHQHVQQQKSKLQA